MHRWSGCPVADANKGHYRVPNRLIVKGLYPSLTFTWRPKIPRWQTARKEDDNSWIFWFLDDLSPELTPFKSCEVVRDCVRVVFISIDFELNLCVAKWNMSKCSPNRWQVNVCHKLTEKKMSALCPDQSKVQCLVVYEYVMESVEHVHFLYKKHF